MQGTSRMDRELFDAAEIVGDLVPPGSLFAFLAQHRGELFDDGFIADLFPSKTGRPSLPADLVGSVLVLKELYGLSDPQTAEALKFDIRLRHESRTLRVSSQIGGPTGCRLRSFGRVLDARPRPGVRRRSCLLGCEAQGRSPRAPAPSGGTTGRGEGRAGERN
jgi:transposase-like protein DUF772